MTIDADSPNIECDRYWFLTWTTYGTWLPGDPRGFVSDVMQDDGSKVRHNIPGTEYDADMPILTEHAQAKLKGEPVRLDIQQADVLFAQIEETAGYRKWRLFAVAIMANHCHLVVGVTGDPEPNTLLRDFKSYGSRALSQHSEKPVSGRWWTKSGSTRKLPDDAAVLSAVQYTVDQDYPLLIWVTDVPELNLRKGRIV